MKNYSRALLKRFDLLTNKLSSPDQLERISARMKIKEFVETHGKPICDEMFAVLKKRDARNGG